MTENKRRSREDRNIARLSALMGWSAAHPMAVRILGAPIRLVALIPPIGRRLGIVARAVLGTRAFPMHRINRQHGRIGIGGVDEVLTGSKLIHALHVSIGQRLGPAETARILYELGEATTRWEASQALEQGEWAPPSLVLLIRNATVLDRIRVDPEFATFFCRTMDVMCQLIAVEGGWGILHFELGADGLLVRLRHSQEARWMGHSDQPVCHYFAGVVGGYASALTGRKLQARETACEACGAPECIFELAEATGPD